MSKIENHQDILEMEILDVENDPPKCPLNCPQTGGTTTLKRGSRVKVFKTYEVTTFDLSW